MNSTARLLGTSAIADQESNAFARVSGDFNPLHLDPVRARRYQFGTTLIHGINGTLRALDLFFAEQRQPLALTSLQVRFSKPVHQGQELTVFLADHTPSSARIEVHCEGNKAQIIEISWSPDLRGASSVEAIVGSPAAAVSQDINIEEADGLDGTLQLIWEPELFTDMFPALTDKLPEAQCATILGTTNIVGMICPGLNSVYAHLELNFNTEANSAISTLDYRVTSTDTRFSRVLLSISNDTAKGEIEAFFRPPAIQQASFTQIRPLVTEDQFAGRHALVIGGSRGLGEVTAKLLAAGGASTLITFANGHEDAARVSEEICSGGGKCTYRKLDILDNSSPEVALEDVHSITDIFYMASPLIEKSGGGLWNADLFSKYTDFYLRGLADVLTPFAKNPNYRNAALTVYLPSTVFLDKPEKGFSEYIVAKAAVESFAEQLRNKYPKWQIHTPRLPRMLTDQTSGITGLDPLDSARHILNSLQGNSR